MTPPSSSTMTLMVLLPLLVWRVYARFKRSIGRQRLSKVRPWVTLVIFPLILTLLVYASRNHTERLVWLVGGLVLGAVLGRWGLATTKFEPTPQALYYTPNLHLGIALSSLMAARVGYRVLEMVVLDPGVHHTMEDFGRSPATLVVMGLSTGYYLHYAAGLLRWRWGLLRAKREREALAAIAQSAADSGDAA
jgi:hypothetical protein